MEYYIEGGNRRAPEAWADLILEWGHPARPPKPPTPANDSFKGLAGRYADEVVAFCLTHLAPTGGRDEPDRRAFARIAADRHYKLYSCNPAPIAWYDNPLEAMTAAAAIRVRRGQMTTVSGFWTRPKSDAAPARSKAWRETYESQLRQLLLSTSKGVACLAMLRRYLAVGRLVDVALLHEVGQRTGGDLLEVFHRDRQLLESLAHVGMPVWAGPDYTIGESTRQAKSWTTVAEIQREQATTPSRLKFGADAFRWCSTEFDPERCRWDQSRQAMTAFFGYSLAYQHVIFGSGYVNEFHDRDGQPHNERGPAVVFPGWDIWAIDGVYLPGEIGSRAVLAPDRLTVEELSAIDNVESRRVCIERFGWERFLNESGSIVLNTRVNERDAQDETLYCDKFGDHRILLVDPSTGRKYAIQVPKDVMTCHDAQNWMTHGLDDLAIHRS